MSTIGTSIVLADNMTSTLMNITNSLNLTVSAFQDVQTTAADDISTSTFDSIREQINAATIATQQFENELNNIKPKTVPVEVKPVWDTQNNIEILQASAIERFASGMNSLGNVINEVSNAQQRIGEQALSMDILPPNASWDINATNQRIDELSQKLSRLQGQDVSFIGADGIGRINGEYESLRHSMNSVVSIQEQMNQTMEDSDVSTLNAGYRQLNNIVEQMERRIQNNLAAIQQMNNIQWKSIPRFEIVEDNGISRLQSEMESLQTIMGEVSDKQQNINSQAIGIQILPSNAVDDINTTSEYIAKLMKDLEAYETINFDLLGETDISKLNSDIESTRTLLTSIASQQNSIADAINDTDITSLNKGFDLLNGGAEQLHQMIRASGEAIQQINNVQWNSPQSIQVFGNTGSERFEKEITNALNLMNALSNKQNAVTAKTSNMHLLPQNAISDIEEMSARILALRNQIERVQNARIRVVGVEQANSEVETLREQLNQALQIQEELNSAMGDMDISAANAAYSRLNSIVDATERNIRDNTSEQTKFNQALQRGETVTSRLQDKITGMAAVYLSIQGAKQVVGLSDTMAQTESRLSLILDDGGSVDALQDKIFASAQRTGTAYLEVSNSVAQLGLMAGRAFSSNDEIIMFTELMNKNFAIGGQDIQAQTAAMRQLTQAMAAGRLQGDEFVSVMEGAPLLAQSIADYMGMPIERIKELSSESLITADVVKGAMFSSIDEINDRYEQLPQTFSKAMTNIQSSAVMVFEPVMKRLNEVANSPQFQVMVQNIVGVLAFASDVAMELFDIIGATAGFISDNWSIIAPWIMAAATALSVYTGFVIAYNTIQTISNGIAAISAARSAVKAGLTLAEAAATTTTTDAQVGLNAALLACPITWIIIAVIALIAIFYAVVAAVNKFAGTSVSATGIIFGAFAWLGSVVANIFMAMLELVFGVVNLMVNPFIQFANFVGNFLIDPVSSIIYLFQGMADVVLGILENIASALDFIFGSNMADTVSGWRSGLKGMANALVESRGYNPDDFNAISELDLSVEKTLGWNRFDNTDVFESGYNAGENLENSISNFDSASLFDAYIPTVDDYANTFDLSAMAGDVGSIDQNTKDMVTASEEDLKYLRDIAERETINRFTTAELTVNFDSKAEIKSNLDLDGVVAYLEEKVAETLEAVAEGVHE